MDRLHAYKGESRACPTARGAVSIWTRCGERLAPGRLDVISSSRGHDAALRDCFALTRLDRIEECFLQGKSGSSSY